MNKTKTMKANFLRLLLAGLGLLLMACVLNYSLSAQTIISFDSTPDHEMVLRIQNHDPSTSAHTYVFIFDSARVTYEFDENGDIEFYTMNHTGSGGSTMPVAKKEKSNSFPAEPEINFSEYLKNEPAEEEPMELENWMLTPKNWLN